MDFTTAVAVTAISTTEKSAIAVAPQPQSPIKYSSSSSSISSIIPMDQSQQQLILETSSNQSTTNDHHQQQQHHNHQNNNHEAIASSSSCSSSPTTTEATPKMTVSDLKLSTTLLEDFTELPANEIEKKCSICM